MANDHPNIYQTQEDINLTYRWLVTSKMSGGDDEMTNKLMRKISEQANELSSLYSELSESRHVIDNLEQRLASQPAKEHEAHYLTTSSSISREAQQRRHEKQHKDQIHALERQLAMTQSRLEECGKQKNQLVSENEKLTRESKFYHKQATEGQHEVQKYRSQLEIFQKKFTTPKVNADGTRQFINPLEEVRTVRVMLSKCERERDALASSCEELKLKITVLEDALEYRADEIGLSGHADLLTKIAHLRGEITALRRELISKTDQLDTVAEQKSEVEGSKQSLEQQVAAMQSRLAQAHNDLSRCNPPVEGSSPTLLEQVKAAEQERDLLVEFIQSDMQKSAAISLDLEKCRSELRLSEENKEGMERRLQLAEEKNQCLLSRQEHLDTEIGSCRAKLDEASRREAVNQNQLSELHAILEQKGRELEEVYKVQAEFLSQAKVKDAHIEELEREGRENKAKCHEYELESSTVAKEVVTWKGRYDEVVDEVTALRSQMSHARPRLDELEPRVEQLSREKSDWLSERDFYEAEVKKLRVTHDLVEELSTEFDSMKEYELESAQGEGLDGGLGLAKKHAIWCGMPAIRRLSASLYDRIRLMFQDLHRTEVDLVRLQEENGELTRKHNMLLEDHERINDKFAASEGQMSTENAKLHRIIESLENANDDLKYKSGLIGQLRDIFRSAVQMTNEPDSSHVSSTFVSNQSPVPRGSGGECGGTYMHGYDLDGPLDEVHLEDLAALSLPASPASDKGSTHKFIATAGHNASLISQIDQADDFELPQLISKTLMHHINASNKLRECETELQDLRRANSILLQKASVVSAQNSGLQRSMHDTQHHLETSNREHTSLETSLHHQLDSAADLAERQNALIVTLEAKLVEMKRKMMLKSAQVTSLQQRESSMQKKLFAFLSRFSQTVTFQLTERPPGDELNLPELLHLTGSYLEDILRFDQNFKHPMSTSRPTSKQQHSRILGRSGTSAQYEYPIYSSSSSSGDEKADPAAIDTKTSGSGMRLSPSRPPPRRPMY